MAVGDRKDPYRSYQFLVEIDGHHARGLPGVLGARIRRQDAIEYREGNEALTTRKLPGLVKYSNISLKWGITDDAELWAWRNKVVSGKIERRNGSIILLDDTGAEKVRWNFREAWPTKWTGPSFNATGNDVAIETLEIAHEGLVKA